MGSVDFTAVVFGASFLVFIGLMNLAFFKPMANLFTQRGELIDGNKKRALNLIEAYDQKLEKYTVELQKARHEASLLLHEATEEAKIVKQKLIEEALLVIKIKRQKHIAEIEKNKEELLKDLNTTVREISSLIVEKILDQDYAVDLPDEKINSALSKKNSNKAKIEVGV